MTEKDFLQAIINDPDDDVPRLIFADWLEEHENQERAEFIRLQVERVRDPSGDASRPTLIEGERQLLGRHQQRWLAEAQGRGVEEVLYNSGLHQEAHCPGDS